MIAAKILIVDDENMFREDLAKLLCRRGYDCKTAVDGNMGLAVAKEFAPDVVLCDIVMPGLNGIELLGEISRSCPESFVIMITAYGTIDTAVEAFRKGASDYITKPLMLEDVLQKIERLVEHKRLNREIRFLRQQLHRQIAGPLLVGQSEQIKKVRELVRKVSTTASTVLITGASGTGKELVARGIHKSGATSEEPFVAINCAGIPEHLLESELFGHTKGAFTGADNEREGFFELAGNGTILLDEIGDTSPAFQVKLLRILEEHEFQPLGAVKKVKSDVRILAATNKDLSDRVDKGEFRQDLFYRINVVRLKLPPLRDRMEDITLLIDHFVSKMNMIRSKAVTGIDQKAMGILMGHHYPGNIRELENIIEHAFVLCSNGNIQTHHLPGHLLPHSPLVEERDTLNNALKPVEATAILNALKRNGYNRKATALELGMHKSTLFRKIQKLGISLPRVDGRSDSKTPT